jgi:alpha,alpha-trehalose-phosphate synthase [UDP-forming]
MSPSRGGGSLIVVSNRLPYNIPRGNSGKRPQRNVGGLVNALEPVLASRGGSWIGWDGHALGNSVAVFATSSEPRHWRTESGVDFHGVPLSEPEIVRYYHGASNRTLWPLFHGLQDKTVFDPEDFKTYVGVNERFARTALSRAGKGDRVWVHDYQLMLVPRFLRELSFTGRIDFFLHIPFPAPEAFRTLPWREELLQSLLGSDTIGFHIDAYRDNFVRATLGLLGGRASCETLDDVLLLRHPWGSTLAATAPIGIEVGEFERIARLDSVDSKVGALRQAHGGRPILFGADRLDYTKGIKERLLAVECFLAKYPDRAGTFDFVQMVVPSRAQVEEYRDLKREIDRTVGRINGEYGREGWTPIHYMYRALSREDLVAFYKACRVALVTPLCDGMNLVAPEFVASRVDDDGVLVLSEFAGVAEHLAGALHVNPYDVESFAEVIRRALDMTPEARAKHMSGLRSKVRSNPVSKWAKLCLGLGSGSLAKHVLGARSGVPIGEDVWRVAHKL